MRASLERFVLGIDDLLSYLNVLKLQSEVIKYLLKMPDDSISKKYAEAIKNFTGMRKLEYSCTVITLYGLLERFIEDLIEEYIDEIGLTVSEYKQLPEALINAHYELSLQHLSRARHKRYRGITLPETIINNLNSCLQSLNPFSITTESFKHHTSNFRHEAIDEFFQKVGLQQICLKAVSTKSFISFVKQLHSPNIYANSVHGRIPHHIDELTERRNEVAHGAISDILSCELLIEYIYVIKQFCFALHEVTLDELGYYKAKHKGTLIGRPIRVYNNDIVCLNTCGHEIKKKDHIAIETGCNLRPFRLAEVSTIQIDGEDVLSTPKGSNVTVGLKVNRRVKDTYDIYLLTN